jgi:predicted secreted Zn-dependent protease
MSNLKEIARKIGARYKGATNMSCAELIAWKKNPCSRKASIGRAAINRNIRLKCKPVSSWNAFDLKEAKKAISYLARAKKIKGGKRVKGCGLTKNQIALKNWAFDILG